MNRDQLPVLVACGQITERNNDANGSTPLELMSAAARLAERECGVSKLLSNIDTIACTGLTVDEPSIANPLSGLFANPPKTLAKQLGIEPRQFYYAASGGNSPQVLVNHFAAELFKGKSQAVLISGGEAIGNMLKRFNHWSKLLLPKDKWRDHPGGKPTEFGTWKPSGTKIEARYDLKLPAHVYPLFENALRIHYRRSHAEHRQAIGELFSGLTKVAAANPNAWFQQERSAAELLSTNNSNRMIAYPYTKLLNSMIYVNQAAALVMTTVGKARELGIDSDRFVYLHGYADANDIWNVSERENFHSSPAMRFAGQQALQMAHADIDAIKYFDIYSCFPSAVQVACDAFGLSSTDPRGLSLTGGLPYFGGPGNSYSLFAIAQMVKTLQQDAGEMGLLNANGWFLTKHSVGVYSSKQPALEHQAEAFTAQPAQIALGQGPAFIAKADGKATLETFTVLHDKRGQPSKGIMYGRLDNDQRFLAEVQGGVSDLQALMDNDDFEIRGEVRSAWRKNRFYLA